MVASRRIRRASGLLAAGMLLSIALAAPAGAASPGRNGALAFVRGADVWSVQPDGSRAKLLIADASAPAWSADGARIAFVRSGEVWTATWRGRREHQVTTGGGLSPTWSPDGNRIAFERDQVTWIAGSDGSDAHQVGPTPGPLPDDTLVPTSSEPDWSPDGATIAVTSFAGFPGSEIRGLAPDGSAFASLANDTDYNGQAEWAPTGNRLALTGSCCHHAGSIVYAAGSPISPADSGDPDGPLWITSSWPAWSPDGGRVAYQSDAAQPGGPQGLFTYQAASGTTAPLIEDATQPDWQPLVAPDCSAVTAEPDHLWPADGRLHRVRLTAGEGLRVRILRVTTYGHGGWREVFAPAWRRSVWLRATRTPSSGARVYRLGFAVAGPGGSCRGRLPVAVAP